jgi:S-adenosylmethionine hydrolase
MASDLPRPIVALLTDFGTRDHYVGTMKAVVLGVCPEATLVDIVHDIPPHDVLAGALELAAAYRYFPAGTVFLVVVDPGVGTGRRALAAAAGGYRFVGPDNGVLSEVFREAPPARVVALTNRKYARPEMSRTFEGRDRFAPAAGWLASGVELEVLGERVVDYQVLQRPVLEADEYGIRGVVVRVDRFGNLITNIDRAAVDRHARGEPPSVRIEGNTAPVVQPYGDAPAGALCALFGSTDHLEVAVNGGSAAERLGLGRGAGVTVLRSSRR